MRGMIFVKINKKYRGVVFSCLAAAFISIPIAFFMVLINYGFGYSHLCAIG